MFRDTREFAEREAVHTDVCIVGGGAAGIALARSFVDTPVRVVLLESGGLGAEANGGGIYQVMGGSPTPKLVVDPSRAWHFGGMTNHWAANCRPLDEADFEPRDWIPHSGWPIRRHHLQSYYERAQSIFGLSDFSWYDPDLCQRYRNLPLLNGTGGTLVHKVMQACPIPSFATLHGERLASAENVQVWLHAHALLLKTNHAGDQVDAVEVFGADERRIRIEARTFVLASGGVENARLLLCSRNVNRIGATSDHDVVGRFFMEHWYIHLPLDGWERGRDLAFYEPHLAGPACVWSQLVLAEEVQRRERVPGVGLWFRRLEPPPDGNVTSVAAQTTQPEPARSGDLWNDILLAWNDPGSAARQILRKVGLQRHIGMLQDGYYLMMQLEQLPAPQNRIRLTSDCDRFGQPYAELALGLTPEDRRQHAKALQIAAAALGMNGKRFARLLELRLRSGRYGFMSHHMGTTRMHDDPAQGVVDANCRVHGVANLFVAGGSVFTTSGTAAPTLTIVALALRLADHLNEVLGVSACL